MTHHEFTQGWELLLAQPWGRRYATVKDQETARTAATQLGFYFRKLGSFDGQVWYVTCELFAQGDHWPTVDELRITINHNLPQRMRLEYLDTDECPEPIALALSHAEAHSVTFIEGVQAIFPRWCEMNKTHEDYYRAAELLKQFRHAKPFGKTRMTMAMRGKES